MKDPQTILNDFLDSTLRMIGEDNYRGSTRIATDVITYSLLADYPDGVFLGETFEGVFSQIAPVIDNVILTDDEKSIIRNVFVDVIKKIRANRGLTDKNSLYNSLCDLRFVATKQQFDLTTRKMKQPEGLLLGRRKM